MNCGPMKVSSMKPIPSGENPFSHDLYNMGTPVGSNLMVMYDVHDNASASYLIIVNKETGERLNIEIPHTCECDTDLVYLCDIKAGKCEVCREAEKVGLHVLKPGEALQEK